MFLGWQLCVASAVEGKSSQDVLPNLSPPASGPPTLPLLLPVWYDNQSAETVYNRGAEDKW